MPAAGYSSSWWCLPLPQWVRGSALQGFCHCSAYVAPKWPVEQNHQPEVGNLSQVLYQWKQPIFLFPSLKLRRWVRITQLLLLHGTMFEFKQSGGFNKTHLEIWRQKGAIEPYHMWRINVKSQEHSHTLAEQIYVSMGCVEIYAPELIVAKEVKGH